MMNWFGRGSDSEEFERDMMLTDALRALDPATHDPNYWLRFRGWVMAGAGRELARRRLMAGLTVGDVLTSWARAVVPTAAFAAALAALVLMRAGTVAAPQPISIEELLVSELPIESVPVLLSPDAASGLVAFASEIF